MAYQTHPTTFRGGAHFFAAASAPKTPATSLHCLASLRTVADVWLPLAKEPVLGHPVYNFLYAFQFWPVNRNSRVCRPVMFRCCLFAIVRKWRNAMTSRETAAQRKLPPVTQRTQRKDEDASCRSVRMTSPCCINACCSTLWRSHLRSSLVYSSSGTLVLTYNRLLSSLRFSAQTQRTYICA